MKKQLVSNFPLSFNPAKSICALLLLLLVKLTIQAQDVNSDVFNKNNIKSRMLQVTAWQLKNPKHTPTDWTNGAFYAGVVAAYETTKSKVILDSLMALGERTGWKPGPRYDHADDITISQTYIDIYRKKKDRRMIQATIDTVQKLRTVPGREARNHKITWWWCDALFMAPPTLAKLGTTLKDPSYYTFSDFFLKKPTNCSTIKMNTFLPATPAIL